MRNRSAGSAASALYVSARILIGAVVWLGFVSFKLPSPLETAWAEALLLFAALVLVPIGFELHDRAKVPAPPPRLRRWIDAIEGPAAVLLVLAFHVERGALAALLAAPWTLTTALFALGDLEDVRARGVRSLSSVCLAATPLFLAIGGAWTACDRLGVRPLDFDPVIVLLTAVHFHYAGFALPLATGLAIERSKDPATFVAGFGVVAGVPLVAAGITASQLGYGPALECAAAWVLALGGASSAWLHLGLALGSDERASARGAWAIAGVALAASMLLAALYGSRAWLPIAWLDIPWMRALHGTLSAFGFALCALGGWRLAVSAQRPSEA